MRGSACFQPIFPSPVDLPSRCSTSRRRVRFSTPSHLWMVVLGILTLGLCLSQHMTRAPRAADPSLLGEHLACVESVVFDSSGRWLASSGGDGSVYLWAVHRHELGVALQRAQGSEAIFGYCLAFAPDGSSLAAANSDGSVTLWNVGSGTHRRTFRFSTECVRCVAYSPLVMPA
jgi:WD40 repeat protein